MQAGRETARYIIFPCATPRNLEKCGAFPVWQVWCRVVFFVKRHTGSLYLYIFISNCKSIKNEGKKLTTCKFFI